MARIPPLTRLQAEDFSSQSEWIEKLLGPLNRFMELTTNALNKQLTLEDNMAATIKTVELDGTFPVRVAWTLPGKPVSVLVGNIYRADGAPHTMTAPVGVQWSYNSGVLSIDNAFGVVPAAVSIVANATYVETTPDTFYAPNHNMPTGTKVVFSTSTTAPTGLTDGGTYYVISVTASKISLASSYDNAIAGTEVDFTTTGSGLHTITPQIHKRMKLVLECKAG